MSVDMSRGFHSHISEWMHHIILVTFYTVSLDECESNNKVPEVTVH